MGFLFALLAVFGEGIAKTVDKINYGRNQITVRQQFFLTFLGMTVSLSAFALIARLPLPKVTVISIWLLSVIAIISFVSNIFDEKSLQMNDLSLREPVLGMQPALAGFIGYLLFPAERKLAALIAFAAAILVLSFGISWHRLQKSQLRGLVYLIIGVTLYSLLPALYKQALLHVSPAYIALFRTAVILLLSMLFFRPSRRAQYNAKKIRYGLSSGILYAAVTVFELYAISHLGVVQTMLLTLLGPAIIYLTSYFILKEQVKRAEVIASGLLALVAVIGLAF